MRVYRAAYEGRQGERRAGTRPYAYAVALVDPGGAVTFPHFSVTYLGAARALSWAIARGRARRVPYLSVPGSHILSEPHAAIVPVILTDSAPKPRDPEAHHRGVLTRQYNRAVEVLGRVVQEASSRATPEWYVDWSFEAAFVAARVARLSGRLALPEGRDA